MARIHRRKSSLASAVLVTVSVASATYALPAAAQGLPGYRPPAAEAVPPPPQAVDEEDRTAIYEALEKSEAFALTTSIGAGFGAGNYYAGNPEAASIAVISQTITIVIAFINGNPLPPLAANLGLRILDGILAVRSTGDYNNDLQQRFQLGKLRKKLTFAPGVDPKTRAPVIGLALSF